MPKTKMDPFELSNRFNDLVMRELGLDIDDRGYIVDLDTEAFLTIKEKYIKYKEEPYTPVKHDEIELNLIENPRLMETITLPFMVKYCKNHGWEFHSTSQCLDEATGKGYYLMSYTVNGETHEIHSDNFINESLRVFNLICKLNKTEVMYKFQIADFDIEIKRKA